MSFDKNDGVPSVNVHKRTTKVNLSLIGAVLIFFVLGAVAAFVILRSE